jgi:hypothetical protein
LPGPDSKGAGSLTNRSAPRGRHRIIGIEQAALSRDLVADGFDPARSNDDERPRHLRHHHPMKGNDAASSRNNRRTAMMAHVHFHAAAVRTELT